jgi:hypothetical protein
MPQAGVSTRARRRSAAPWSDELDRDTFRFPTDRSAPVAAPLAANSQPRVADGEPRAVTGERRTVTIRGRGAERNLPVARPTLRRHERPGFKADRAALWAVMLGLLLILVAAASAHGAVLH